MSIKLTRRAYEKDVDASTQRVLLVLCDFANDDGVCWPSIDLIAWKLGCNRKTVMRAIARLEACGAVRVERQHRHNNRYHVHLERIPDKPPFRPAKGQNGTQADGQHGTQQGQDGTQLSPPRRDPIESPQEGLHPSGNRQGNRQYTHQAAPSADGVSASDSSEDASSAPAADPILARFDRWWHVYPRKQGIGAARKLWQRLAPDEAVTGRMIRAVERQKRSEQWRRDGGRYVPNPAKWLEAERWLDEPETTGTRSSVEPPAWLRDMWARGEKVVGADLTREQRRELSDYSRRKRGIDFQW